MSLASGTRLNLGCGNKHIKGFINVDKEGNPDLKHDLEKFPWPWQENSVDQILMIHVLEHLGKEVDTYFQIIKELYRVCKPSGRIRIIVPHFRHKDFYTDPTHIRVITPEGLNMFSKKQNKIQIKQGLSDSTLGIQLNVDLELRSIRLEPSEHWYKMHPHEEVDVQLLIQESEIYNGLIKLYDMELEVIKP